MSTDDGAAGPTSSTDDNSAGISISQEAPRDKDSSAARTPEGPEALPADDVHGETDGAPQATRFQKIRDAGEGLFRKFGLRRGPGRPPKCAICGLSQTDCLGHVAPGADGFPRVIPPGAAGDPAADAVPRDPLVIRRSIAAMARALRKFADKLVYQKAFEASEDKSYAETIVKETSASDDECDALGEVTDIVLKELGLDSKYLPLAAALVVVAGAGTRYTLCIKHHNKKINERRRQERPRGATA